MKTSSKTYRVVCKTDLYHASRKPRFNSHTGEWCEPEWRGLSLKEANALLFKFFEGTARQYFDNWGLAVIYDIVLVQTGNFTVTFCDDAGTVAETLGLVLLKDKSGTPYCSFPNSATDNYVPRLARTGLKLCICVVQ